MGYSDADWGGDRSDRKSTSGYLFQVCGAAVSWRSKKQTCVALSTAEAEYMALASATQEAVWLEQLTADFGIGTPEKTIVIFEDNQSAISMTKNPQFHGRNFTYPNWGQSHQVRISEVLLYSQVKGKGFFW